MSYYCRKVVGIKMLPRTRKNALGSVRKGDLVSVFLWGNGYAVKHVLGTVWRVGERTIQVGTANGRIFEIEDGQSVAGGGRYKYWAEPNDDEAKFLASKLKRVITTDRRRREAEVAEMAKHC